MNTPYWISVTAIVTPGRFEIEAGGAHHRDQQEERA